MKILMPAIKTYHNWVKLQFDLVNDEMNTNRKLLFCKAITDGENR